MDDIQINKSATYNQASQAKEAERQKYDDLVLGGPGLINPAERVSEPADDGLRPEDSFQLTPPEAASPVASIPTVQAGPQIAQDVEDVVLAMDGRGAAVALQEYLQGLLKNQQGSQFEATAQALGVKDVGAFEESVGQGNALQTFSQIDSNRLMFTDQSFNELAAEQLPAVAKAQMVIKPSYEVPLDPEIRAPEIVLTNPNEKLMDRLETPIFQDPAEQMRVQQTNPQALSQNDGTAAFA